MTIACDPAIGHVQHGIAPGRRPSAQSGHAHQIRRAIASHGSRAAKHDAVIQTHPHLVEQAFIGDAEQSGRAWRLQRNEREPAASERAPEAAQHAAAEPALVVVVNGRHVTHPAPVP